jgi:molybdopterin converting factor small subunit
MSIEIEFSSVFTRYTNNQSEVKVEGKTVGECLHDLARQYPKFGEILLEKNGDILPTFDIFVNGEDTYPHAMTYPIKDGDKISIILLIHGG